MSARTSQFCPAAFVQGAVLLAALALAGCEKKPAAVSAESPATPPVSAPAAPPAPAPTPALAAPATPVPEPVAAPVGSPYGDNLVPAGSGAVRTGQVADPYLAFAALTDDPDVKAVLDELRRGGPTKQIADRVKAHAAAAGPALLKAMWTDNTNVRSHAPTLLATLEPPITPEVGAAFNRSLLYEAVPSVRANVAAALTDYNVPAIAGALLEVLEKDGDANARSFAAYALGLLKNKAALPALIKATRDKETWVRLRSVKALGKIGDAAARGAVLSATKDPNKLVRENAREALGRLR